ncbi:DUF2188 domain-containing protein [Virgibacillus xinjiangensis]|uniref:DUF2188 domain-containing protein n=1 Tax=Virgibacillus xinjiangensis TaxID=393090 RepID=A0ABV7CYQ7_9BACI
MPWTMNDYPSSMKNLNTIIKKKAIDIANSMVDEGYEENRAIPIAIEQAKEWHENASQEELDEYKSHGKPTKRSSTKKRENSPERMEEEEQVISHEDGWAVQSAHAKKPDKVYRNKKEAVKRAKEIARNKGTSLKVFKHDGSVQETKSYK